MTALRRLMASWQFRRALSKRLAARRLLRPLRREAALKGWQTRRAG
jgi:hypothetical protein